MRSRMIDGWVGLAVAGAVLGAAARGLATDYNASQSGPWDQAATWGGSGVPGAGDGAYVSYNSGNNLTVDVTNSAAALSVGVGHNSLTGTLRIDAGGSLTTGDPAWTQNGNLTIGYLGSGYLEINGGTLTCHRQPPGSLALIVSADGATYGACTQYAGAVTCDGADGILQVCRGAGTGVYTLVSGTVSAPDLQVGGGPGVGYLYITGAATVSCPLVEVACGTGTGIVVQSTGVVQVADTRIGKGNGGGYGVGQYQLNGGAFTSTTVEVGYWVGAQGTLEINGGRMDLGAGVIDGIGARSMELGMGNSCVGIVTQRAGAVTATGFIQLGNQAGTSTGRYVICGGTLTATNYGMANGNGTSVGLFHVIGTNAAIALGWYAQSASSTLRLTFGSGTGISTINLVKPDSDVVASGTLTLDILGQVALWTTNDFLPFHTPYFDTTFTATNPSIFVPLKDPPYPYHFHVTLDNAFKMAATAVPYTGSASFTPANKGWLAIDAASIPPEPFDVWLTLQTNGASHTLSEIAAQVATSGLGVASRVIGPTPALRLTLPAPTANPSYLGWDFGNFDANVLVQAVRVGPSGSMVIIR